MERIDLETARGLLVLAMETQGPDFIYNMKRVDASVKEVSECFNVPATDPRLAHYLAQDDIVIAENSNKLKTGCLVGTAMKLSGVVPEDKFPVRGGVSEFAEWLTDDAKAYFYWAQYAQDEGRTWGWAVERAEEEMRAKFE